MTNGLDGRVPASTLSWHTALTWPLATLDFEASSFEHDSYPIEVGVALWLAPDQPVLGWSTLIRPTGIWERHGHWSTTSAKVHGITAGELFTNGQASTVVATMLNTALCSGVVWCDGGQYDAEWARTLFMAADVEQQFTLGDWNQLAASLDPAARQRALGWLKRGLPRHRARADAEQLLLAPGARRGCRPR